MQILFLNEQTLEVIDHGYATNDYEIVLDALIPQKSSFQINKQSTKAEIGDYLVVRENDYFYIGIIASIEAEDKGYLKVSTKDFLSKFDVEVPVASFSGNISQFLLNLINSNFKSSGDAKQNLSYLQTAIEVVKTGTLNYEDDKTENILDLVEEFSKTYGIRLSYQLIVTNGVISNILVSVVSVSKSLKLRSDLGTISNLIISDTNEVSLNKVIYRPKAENSLHTSTIAYYLLRNGIVSTDFGSSQRYDNVIFKYQFYSDKDFDSLQTKATSELIDSSLKHSISFDFSFISNKIASLKDLSIGDFVIFIAPSKTYETIVSKITYKGTLNVASIVLGEYRITLTDKLKLLDRRK
jgi:hypothetical protein